MSKPKSAEEYINKHPEWRENLELFREILLDTELTEHIKWGIPYYTIKNKNVLGFAAFKKHVAIWFVNGVFLDDPNNLLVNAQEGVTKAVRQLRYNSGEKPDKKVIKNFVEQAIANQKAGKEVKPEKKETLQIPPELKAAFSEHSGLEKSFNSFTAYKKREFADYISEAKQAATKERRLAKIIPLMQEGIGLHDKYR
ncbi:MAG: DUF1801 domain-containing protein [Balneolaceae bacterium]